QPYIYYAATASGGLWKTVNNGITFEPIFDYESVFSIGDVAVSQANPDIVWVGTGEANNSRSCYWGDGVYKSTDAGKTWKNMGLKESHHIGRIVIHPTNPDIVYVAALGHLFSDNPERGLYKTIDGGETWEKTLEVIDHEKYIGVVDVVMDPTNSVVLYAASFDKVRKPYTYNLGGPGSGIYKTEDAGNSWKKLVNGLPTGMLGKIGVNVYLRDSNIVYAVIENANKPDMSAEERYQELLNDQSSQEIYGNQVYRSDNAGETWRMVSPKGFVVGGGTPYYYQQIRVDPNNPDHVYNLSTRVDHSTDGGKTWERAFQFGGDNHALWIDPENSNHLLLGYDHGMGVTYDAGLNWYHPDNIPLAQFYAIGVDMEYPYNVYGGTQDNGSLKGPNTKRNGGPIYFEDWAKVGGGDGFYNVVDPTDSRWLYNESQFGNISRLDQKTGERVRIKPQDPDLRFNWNAPILISPHNPKVIYFGTNKLLRSDNRGDTWVEVSSDLSTNDPKKLTTGKGGDGNIQYCTITTIDESPLVPGLLWVGTDDGNVHISKDGGGNWTQLNSRISGNPGYWVSRVTASNHDPGTAYVSYTGYRRDDFRPFIYKTTDYGQTWASIAANLSNEPINVVKEDRINPNLLYVGTEFAVYISIDSGKSWVKMKNNMPTQPVQDLLIHPRE
ncbi:WD40/YVTN/BNR-like repeat-containing protein, partial [Acidobacteriota bacterium]